MSQQPPDPLIGQQVAGCRIERLLGRGGMGAAYLARGGRGAVVIKVLDATAALNPSLRKRFQREALALKRVRAHPHVVRVFEVGEGDLPCIIMEYVDGSSLEDLLQRRGRLAVEEAVRIARDVALGLVVIDNQGIVHRDIKPANILLTSSGQAKIVDLGLAKDAFLSGLTAPGQVLGTVRYMAPEQWRQETQGPACDLFALGATLYHLVTGRPPFGAEEVVAIAEQATTGDFPPPRAVVPSLPRELELVVLQLLMPDPTCRYSAAEAVVADLEGFLQGDPASVPALLESADPTRRYPLLPGRRFTLGRDAACDLVIEDSSLGAKHARITRKAEGYVLNNQRGSTGTWVGDSPVKKAVALTDGDRVRLGSLSLVFSHPQSRPLPPPYLRDVRRISWPEPVVQVLASRGDPRVVLHLLEQLAPAPIAQQRARSDVLGLGESVVRVVLERRREEEARLGAWVPGALAGITGEPATKAAPDWLLWWDMVRTSYPAQIVVARPLPRASLRVTRGSAQPKELALGEGGIALVGRDEKCQLKLTEPNAARLHAAVLRLHTRWLVRDEATAQGIRMGGARVHQAWLPPGVEVDLGEVAFELHIEDEPGQRCPEGHAVVDPLTFQALRDLRHPSVCLGLVRLLEEASSPDWARRAAAALFGETEDAQRFADQLQAHVVNAAGNARQELAATLRCDAGPIPAAWAPLIQQSAARLGPQVLPRGWVAATR